MSSAPARDTVETAVPASASHEGRPLRLLLVEDSERDALLVLRALRQGGFLPICERVETADAMRQALVTGTWDAIISDHQMPQFSGPDALAVLRDSGLDLPFVIVSGNIGEDVAVAAMKAGAHDYVMKHQLARLVPAIDRELQEAVVRRKRRRAEGNTRALLEMAKDISGTLDLDELLQRVTRRTAAMLSCDGVAIFYLDRQREVSRVRAHYGIPEPLVAVAESLRFPRGEAFDGRVANGDVVIIDDLSTQTRIPAEVYEAFGVKSLVAVPLRVADRRLGALLVWSAQSGGVFDQAQVDLCAGIAQQLSVAAAAAELYREQEEQAHVSGAIARIGQSLMATLYAQELLQELCRLTTQELACDCSHTFLRKPDTDVFCFAAGYGDTPEQAESLRVLEVPQAVVANLVAALERQPVAQAIMSQPQDLIPAALSQRYGISAAMYVPLRRDGKLVGIHTACYRGRDEGFSAQQERIAAGLSELASMALENARLVEQLEHADRLKSEFMATMSHELRTPLNIIMGYVDLLLEETFGSLAVAQTETLTRTQQSAHQLLELIEATLDVSRLESGRLTPQLEPVHPLDVIHELERTTQDVFRKPGVAITWPRGIDLPIIRTDPVKLKVILRNLIDNAVKFTDQGEVTISAQAAADGIEVAVRDTGIGIVADAMPIIFEPFRQVDGSDSRRYGGVGLGLYTVRLLVEMLGGTVHVESAESRGSCFQVWIPNAASD